MAWLWTENVWNDLNSEQMGQLKFFLIEYVLCFLGPIII